MSNAEDILRLSKQYEKYTAENLSKIIKMKSLSGGEKEVAHSIKEMMEEAGFDEASLVESGMGTR
jgi:acetylornithine deacetylase/succinyl-diaminopimelate desuccinylase-like protein